MERGDHPGRRDLLLRSLGAAALAGQAAPVGAAEAGRETPAAAFVYEATVTIGPGTSVGKTPYGARNRIPITGGTFEGSRIKGVVLPGGMDWQLSRPDGFTSVEADYMLQTDDGVLIHIVNKGLIGQKDGRFWARTTPWFEAPDGRYAWLNQSTYAGTLTPLPGGAVRIGVFEVV